jgi:hypothetical protein
MKRTYVFAIAVVAIALLALIGAATADIPVNATPETKGITVTTNINAQGTVTASDSLTWQQSSDALNAPPLVPAGAWEGNASPEAGEWADEGEAMSVGEVQYTAGYTEQTLAVQGVTSYTKSEPSGK